MFLRAFKNQRPTTIALLVLVTMSLWSFSIMDSGTPSGSINPSIYSWIILLVQDIPFILELAAAVLIIIQAIMVNNIVMGNQLIATRTYVPSLVYVVLMSCTPELLSFHSGLIGNFFLILMLNRLFATYRSEHSYAKIFDAGLFLGLASTVYFPYVWVLIFGWIALLILRSFAWRDWLIYALGALVPYFFIWTYYFTFDDLTNLQNHFFLFDGDRVYQNIVIPYYYLPVLIFFSILILISAKTVFLEWRVGAIKVKKLLSTLIVFSGIFILFPFVVSGLNITSYVALAIPLSIYIANYFINSKRPLVTEIAFLLLLVSIVYLHIVTL